MKQQRATLLLALAFILCLALPGCTGLIPPTIGESAVSYTHLRAHET